jgi:hypothetical protein
VSDVLQAAPSALAPPLRITAEEVVALRRHPGFAEAARASAAMMVELYQGNRLLNAIVNDRGRLVISTLAVHLHYSAVADDPHSGLTAARVKAFCAAEGVCSPGRAAAVLALMRWAGYVAPAPQAANIRTDRLVATQRLIDLHRERWGRQLEVVAAVLDEGRQALDSLDRPGFAAAFAAGHAALFTSGVRLTDHAPALELFIDRNCGLLILANLVILGAPDDDPLPRRPVPLSISALAKRFGVSRPHVIAVLRDAEAAGLLERLGPGGAQVRLSPRLLEDLESFFGSVFLFNAHSARLALKALAERDAAQAQ